MSFAELRKNRQSKDLKSYVKRLPESIDGETQAAVQPHVMGHLRPIHSVDDRESLYLSLPSSMELRTSKVSGRGLWNMTKVNPGEANE